MAIQPNKWLEELANEHGRMVFSAAYRVLGNADDAEDVLQDVFLRLLRDGRRANSARNWGAWLRTAAVNRAVDALRRRRDAGADSEEILGQLSDATEQNPREILDRQQKAGLLRQALSQLPERDARIFALRHFEDAPYDEIAREEDLSANQVGVILHRARKRLRQILQPLFDQEERSESHVG